MLTKLQKEPPQQPLLRTRASKLVSSQASSDVDSALVYCTRYDHVKVSRTHSSGPSFSLSPNSHPRSSSGSHQVTHTSEVPSAREHVLEPSKSIDVSTMNLIHKLPSTSVWTSNFETVTSSNDELGDHPTYLTDSDRPICSFAAAGRCPYGQSCPRLHGDLCTICGKHCLHPFRPDEREEHIKMCQKNNKHLEALKYSQEIECSVCLDRVHSKPNPAERKFGLLSECDHPFCISCIRNWRGNSPASGMDINSALRACPICRKLSYFVIPSIIWYSTKEEKQEIVDNYKAKLKKRIVSRIFAVLAPLYAMKWIYHSTETTILSTNLQEGSKKEEEEMGRKLVGDLTTDLQLKPPIKP
ncbi:hypothetical protein ZIOFF_075170 [Zingiber officinale]|uniref:RING-type E3 ubiquitin transferase n=1 Tax=Zingiber officinale TaxID=94328 RepID=A0A8J5BU17_ZINOF|nr:hypothetical protein ZIOFF_075170 [Zingiber officinale]